MKHKFYSSSNVFYYNIYDYSYNFNAYKYIIKILLFDFYRFCYIINL